MSRFPAPLDDFETDDFDIPTFDTPPRRASRPATSRNASSTSRGAERGTTSRGPAPRGGGAREGNRATSNRDFDPFEDRNFEDRGFERGTSRPRPSTLGRTDAARPRQTRPKTGKGPAPKTAKAIPRVSTPRPRPMASPRVLRAVHFQSAGVLLIALGGLLGYYALRTGTADGILPRYALSGLRWLFGIGAKILPFGIVFLGGMLFIKRGQANLRAFWRGAGTAFFTLLTASHLTVPRGEEFSKSSVVWNHGGYVGGALAYVLRHALGEVGAVIALSAFAFVALLLWTENTVGQLGERIHDKWIELVQNVRSSWKERQIEREQSRAEKESQRAAAETKWEEDDWDEQEEFEEELAPQRTLPPKIVRDAKKATRLSPFMAVEDVFSAIENEAVEQGSGFPDAPTAALDPDSSIDEPEFLPVETVVEAAKKVVAEPKATTLKQVEAPRIEILDTPPPSSVVDNTGIDFRAVIDGENADDFLLPSESLEQQAEASARDSDDEVVAAKPKIELPRRSFGDGPLMPTYFDDAVRALDPPVPPDNAGAEEEIQKGVLGVQETLGAFKIDARVTDVKRGPVITRYEVQPGAGVRVASIANLDKDLARSLSALAVRIEAPVPGKNVVGIEIPNKKVHLVRMRDVLEQPDFLAHSSKLAFVLGKDIAGQPKWGDLTKMPHMLIAGSTNSGKSVCLNSIIASILVRAQPDEVRFSLIDPKRVELTLYRGIAHLMHDVVVEPKQAVIALRRSIEEMDRRYKLFATRGVRNIVSYNSKLKEGEKPMPYIVIVIDELADLMMTAAAEFEKLICRLAQLARATGIHLIVATQRPSVNVITGVIKANIPARIAFAVASQVDSRTILDSVGAERLIGSGDMLYDSNNGGKSVRIQGAFLSEEEVNRIVDVVKGAYLYEEGITSDLPTFDLYSEDTEDDFAGEKVGGSDDKRDSLYDEIKEFVIRHQEMSASLIQRKFEIGYPRAGRIVDQLERDGVLGPADGPKPRKVLASNQN